MSYRYGKACANLGDCWKKGDYLKVRDKALEELRKAFPQIVIMEPVEENEIPEGCTPLQIDTEDYWIENYPQYAKNRYWGEWKSTAKKYADLESDEQSQFYNDLLNKLYSMEKSSRNIFLKKIANLAGRDFPLTDIRRDLQERYKTAMEQKEIIRPKKRMATNNAKALLSNPLLFDYIIEEISKKVAREETTKRAVFLTSCLRLVNNCDATSSNAMINGLPGSGKDFVTKNTLSLWKDYCIKRTRISPTVLTYWAPVESWDGFILYLEDISNGILNHDVFKVMSSGGSHATVVKEQKAIDIEIRGKPVIIITTATAAPKAELLRRFPIIQLDDSSNQTGAVIDKRLDLACQGISPEYDLALINALSSLNRVKVVVNEQVESHLRQCLKSSSHVIMRTNINRIVDLIKASAALYQNQRETNKDGFIVATEEDFERARDVINSQSTTQESIPLTQDQRRILDAMGDDWYTIEDLSDKVKGHSDKWLRKLVSRLEEANVIKKEHRKVEDSKRKVQFFQKVSQESFHLPSLLNPEECQNRSINTSNTNNTINTNDTINGTNESIESIEQLNRLSNENILAYLKAKGTLKVLDIADYFMAKEEELQKHIEDLLLKGEIAQYSENRVGIFE